MLDIGSKLENLENEKVVVTMKNGEIYNGWLKPNFVRHHKIFLKQSGYKVCNLMYEKIIYKSYVKSVRKLLIGTANFKQYSNDLFWRCLFHDPENDEWYNCNWRGYDDNNWWKNVSKNAKQLTVEGNKGHVKTFEINFRNNDVEEIINCIQ